MPPRTLPFTFGIALTPRASAGHWSLVEALLRLTLASAGGQTDPDVRVLIAGHDRPRVPALAADPRVSFVEVDWPVAPPGPHNDDSGRKKHLLNDLVLARGGGLFMLLDADDWVDRRLVATARAVLGAEHAAVGALIDEGVAVDFRSLGAAPLPHPGVFRGGFHRLCGSSTVAHLRPDDPDPLRRDPFGVLRSHHRWVEAAAERGLRLASLPEVSGAYVINTSENHSEVHGPYAAWRRTFTADVNREGQPLDPALAARFGLDLDEIRAASDRFSTRERDRGETRADRQIAGATAPG